MDTGQFDQWVRGLAAVRTRRALGGLLGAVTLGAGVALTRVSDGAAGRNQKKKRKRKRRQKMKQACARCTVCQTCVNGTCQNKLNGTICGSACEECQFGFCGDSACTGNDCLPNQTCAHECDVEVQDCALNCFCTAGVGGLTYCTVDPRPPCAGLATCASTAACPTGFLCQQCDGVNRCVPLCPL
ncbi:MAG: hypothetical protein KC442_03285 [Thermomicrobiales bacterium]|nr:hypothetical protein [Thermomicrobiales bacterium]